MDNTERNGASTNTAKKKLGFAVCGSFCTHKAALEVMKKLSVKYDIVPILSFSAANTDTRFGSAAMLCEKITAISGREPIKTIAEAEKLGPAEPLDLMLICPCTGNTAAKLSLGITDTPVTMAAKAHLRRSKKILVALATNDALAGNIENLGRLMQRKNYFFVPMVQDDVKAKPYSLVADFGLCEKALEEMESGVQLRPIFL